eukprot:Nk52_evm11s128 gene=Nk52_evmTU11s128
MIAVEEDHRNGSDNGESAPESKMSNRQMKKLKKKQQQQQQQKLHRPQKQQQVNQQRGGWNNNQENELENTSTVQLTNDACTISKRSMARKGYFDDNYVRHFIKKPSNRAPLINRFYAVRAKAISTVVTSFVNSFSGEDGNKKVNVISFGCGYDTTYFRLNDIKGDRLSNRVAHYIEIDLPEVVERKRAVILSNPNLRECLRGELTNTDEIRFVASAEEGEENAKNNSKKSEKKRKGGVSTSGEEEVGEGRKVIGLSSEKYHLLGIDLQHLDLLLDCFRHLDVDFSAPTIFLDECALTYVDFASANNVLQWCAKYFSCACSFTYTQIEPNDGFGHIMTSHFRKIQSPLLGIEHFPCVESHANRCAALGFSKVDVVTKYDFYFNHLTAQDRDAFERIEAFDEHEEMHAALQHYCLVLSYTNGFVGNTSFGEFMEGMKMDKMSPVGIEERKKVNAVCNSAVPTNDESLLNVDIDATTTFHNRGKLGRFGHSCSFVPNVNKVFVFGGISSKGVHVSVNTVDVIDPIKNGLFPSGSISGSPPEARFFHSACVRNSKEVVVFGGRTGFKKSHNDIHMLDTDESSWKLVKCIGDAPCGRWRHASCLLRNDRFMIVSGGRTQDEKVLGDFACFDFETSEWSSFTVVGDNAQLALRHSHKICPGDNENSIYVFGGLQGDLCPSNGGILKVNFDFEGKIAEIKVVSKLLPSMFSLDIVETRNGRVIVTGGVRSSVTKLENMFFVFDKATTRLENLKIDFSQTTSAISSKFLLFKHCVFPMDAGRLGIYGGGGCCFSFGTHINSEVIVIETSEEVLSVAEKELVLLAKEKEIPKVHLRTLNGNICDGSIGRGLPNGYAKVNEVSFEECLNSPGRLEALLSQRTPIKLSGCKEGDLSQLWTKDYLLKRCGEKIVSIHKTENTQLDFVNKNFTYICASFRELLDNIYEGSGSSKYYLRSVGENIRKDVSNIYTSFPEIAQDFTVLDLLPPFVREKLFSTAFRISSKDIQIWTHYDIMDNVLCQVAGSKRVVLWHPCEISNLYVTDTCSEVLDIDEPDMHRYPDFPKTRGQECLLNPGDILFIPSLWFHNTTTLSESISVNCFWRHLEAERYCKKDLYGSKDLVVADKALQELKDSVQSLDQLPRHYREFYLAKMVSTLKAEMSKE